MLHDIGDSHKSVIDLFSVNKNKNNWLKLIKYSQ